MMIFYYENASQDSSQNAISPGNEVNIYFYRLKLQEYYYQTEYIFGSKILEVNNTLKYLFVSKH